MYDFSSKIFENKNPVDIQLDLLDLLIFDLLDLLYFCKIMATTTKQNLTVLGIIFETASL